MDEGRTNMQSVRPVGGLRPETIIAILIPLLLAASLAMFIVTQTMVKDHERRLLDNRAALVADRVERLVESLRSSSRTLGEALQADRSPEGFARSTTPLIASRTFTNIALIDMNAEPPTVTYAVGSGLVTSQKLDPARARVAAEVNANQPFASTAVESGPKRIGLIQGGPAVPLGTVIYMEVRLDGFQADRASAVFGNDPDLENALYASDKVSPETMLVSSTGSLPLGAPTSRNAVFVGSTEWLLVTSKVGPLSSSLERAVPWILLIGGLCLTAMVYALTQTLTRRGDEAVNRARERDEDNLDILDAAQEAFITMSPAGLITAWSRQAEVLFGWSTEEALGRRVSETIIPDGPTRGAHEAGVKRLNETRAPVILNQRLELEAVHRDGTIIPIELTVWEGKVDGQIAYKALIHDISDRRAASDELATAHLAALDASRMKSEFLANMSHEIRTPMNGVIGMTDLLLTTPLNTEQREYAETVRNSSESLLTVINDILDFSKIEAGKLALDTVDFAPRAVIEEVVAILRELAAAKGLTLEVHISSDVPTTVAGDPGRVRQILLNLAANAVKFTEVGSVEIRCDASEGDDEHVRLRFEIEDTGIGIDAKHQLSMFESFRQADMSSSRRHEGTGLGLAIARQLSQLMQGDVGVSSVVGEGSTFWFEILVEARDPADTLENQVVVDLRGIRVLIVDNNQTNREILCKYLSSWDMKTEAVDGASSAMLQLTQAADEGEPFAAAVLDFQMPGEDGLSLARRIHTNATLRDTKLLLLTSSDQLLPKAVLAENGISSSLIKPVPQGQLMSRLMAALESPFAAASAAAELDDASPLQEGLHVLLAEDNAVNQRVATLMLQRMGCSFDVAVNGVQAINLATTRTYSAILMDCQMPEADGYEATRAIREHEGQDRHVPIIALTASAMKGDREKALEAGMDDHIPKPVRAAELQMALQRWTSSKSSDAIDIQTSPPEADVDAPDGEVLDTTVLDSLRTAFGPENADKVDEIVEQFLTATRAELVGLSVDVAVKDYESTARLAHKVKGSSGTIGAMRIMNLCIRLQHGAEAHDRNIVAFCVGEMHGALDAVEEALEAQKQGLKQS